MTFGEWGHLSGFLYPQNWLFTSQPKNGFQKVQICGYRQIRQLIHKIIFLAGVPIVNLFLKFLFRILQHVHTWICCFKFPLVWHYLRTKWLSGLGDVFSVSSCLLPFLIMHGFYSHWLNLIIPLLTFSFLSLVSLVTLNVLIIRGWGKGIFLRVNTCLTVNTYPTHKIYIRSKTTNMAYYQLGHSVGDREMEMNIY